MRDFRIAAAQIASIRGDLDANIAAHADAIRAAAGHQVSVLIFPELSLTGYEPDLAADLAMVHTDARLGPLRALAKQHRMDVVVGAPLRNPGRQPALGAIIFRADGTTRTYRKMHLGSSERPWFSAGDEPLALTASGHTIGLGICADSSQASHPQSYAARRAGIYAVGAFMTAEWYRTDAPRYPAHAARFGMLVVVANHGASVGTLTSVGRSAIWEPGGTLLVQSPGTDASLLIATHRPGRWHGEILALGVETELRG